VLTVVMPAHNERDYLAASVGRVVDGLRKRAEPFEIVVVENGSTDETAGVARRLADEHPEVRTLSLPVADYGAALRAGILAAWSEWVVVFDVDYVDLGFLSEARDLAGGGRAAIVVGSKRSPGAEDRRNPFRRLITAGFTLLLRIAFGLRVSDTHGLKLLHAPQVHPLVERTRYGKEIFDTELILRAERSGLTVRELPVRVEDQRPPRSSILRRIPRTLTGLARLRATLWKEQLADRPRRAATISTRR
jgi:glycosyltransferase involved in cell wall biosynthesis